MAWAIEEIDVESVKNNKNKRLTVMIRNIPNRYSMDDLCAVLDYYVAGRIVIPRWT